MLLIRRHASLAVMIVGLITLLPLASLACSGDDDANPTTTPNDKAGPLNFAIDAADQPLLQWDNPADADSYHLTGTARYGPTCEALADGVTDFETITIDEELDGDDADFSLPAPSDDRLDILVELVANLEARNQGGEVVTDAIAFSADPFCE